MSIYDTLNPEQKEAVLSTEGPLLILAGAGSGKTKCITHRIAYLIEEKRVNPWNILAITFTNKAAGEMRERVDNLVGPGANDVWISTFHALCSRILRRNIDMIGFDKNFTIYDTSDQKTLMKEVLKGMNLDSKQFPEKAIISEISSAKNECKSPLDYRNDNEGNFRSSKIADVYEQYQKRLKENNALDFDDLLVKTVELFQSSPDILEYYQNRFQYLMVDEYQDTNTVQFLLISLLARKYKNLCVVGDDDQSIYKFRGANIYNILNFEKVFPDAKVIKLEQNYRSTSNILNAANGVIAHNQGRKEKKLWTEAEKGELVHFKQYDNEYEESEGVAKGIQFLSMRGVPYEDMAILYRTNAQSRIFEEKLKQRGIPYAIVRGISFYDRKEVKDLMSYLKTVESGMDDIAVKRIINVPKRGIGQTTINRIQDFAIYNQMSFLDAVFMAKEIPEVGRAASKLTKFANLIDDFRSHAKDESIRELMEYILETTDYRADLELEGTPESQSRLEDIDELINDIVYYEEHAEEPSLRDFLAEKDMYTLNAGIDNLEEDSNKVLLMTLHNAKGLEFENVFLGGMEEGVFPGFGAMISGDEEEIEEERRLAYVGITRAKKRLYLSAASRRMVRGQNQYNSVSRFVDEIPSEYIDAKRKKSRYDSIRHDDYGWGRSSDDDYGNPFSGRSSSYSNDSGDGGSYGRSSSYGGGSYGRGESYGGGSYGRSNPYGSGTYGRGTGKSSKTSGASAYSLDDFRPKQLDRLDYEVGDRVKHIKFGQGTVTEIVKAGKDFEVAVEFDRVGRKKMFASFAKLKKM